MGPEQPRDWSKIPTSEFGAVSSPGPDQGGAQYPTGLHGQPFQSMAHPAAPYFPQRQGMSAGLVVALTLLAVLLVGLIGAVVYFLFGAQPGNSAAR